MYLEVTCLDEEKRPTEEGIAESLIAQRAWCSLTDEERDVWQANVTAEKHLTHAKPWSEPLTQSPVGALPAPKKILI